MRKWLVSVTDRYPVGTQSSEKVMSDRELFLSYPLVEVIANGNVYLKSIAFETVFTDVSITRIES